MVALTDFILSERCRAGTRKRGGKGKGSGDSAPGRKVRPVQAGSLLRALHCSPFPFPAQQPAAFRSDHSRKAAHAPRSQRGSEQAEDDMHSSYRELAWVRFLPSCNEAIINRIAIKYCYSVFLAEARSVCRFRSPQTQPLDGLPNQPRVQCIVIAG